MTPKIKLLRKLKRALSPNKVDFSPLLNRTEKMRVLLTEQIKQLETKITDTNEELVRASENRDIARYNDLNTKLTTLKETLTVIESSHLNDVDSLTKSILEAKAIEGRVNLSLNTLAEDIKSRAQGEETDKALKDIGTLMAELRIELLTKISSTGGGSMNRQIKVGGVDYLTKYTDINLVAGTNVTLAVTSDNTNKNTKITFNASGGTVNFETPVGTVNDSNTIFTVSNTPVYINVNGLVYTAGNGIFSSYSNPTITLSSPVGTGGFIQSAYQ